MKHASAGERKGPLLLQLGRFIRLRWVAALVVLIAALADWKWFHWYDSPQHIAEVGIGILAYNLAFWMIWRELGARKRSEEVLRFFAIAQLFADLLALTVLTLFTGAINSPIRGFFVLHMVFASLLLSNEMAYGSAALALVMISAGLWFTGNWPEGRNKDAGTLLGWASTVLITVWLANGIVRDLRRQRRRLIKQNKRIRGMTRALKRQQQAMIQHEKMVSAGQMAAGVAHEIANPLASMDGLLQLAQRRPEKMRPEMVTTLREQITRISHIVRRMTTFAHPGDGEWQTGSLNQVVEKAWEVIQFDPRLKGVTVERNLDANLPNSKMMPEALGQVVINLIVNALDAMEGMPAPRLMLRTEHEDGLCKLVVADNGPGIEEKYLKRIFEPFFTTKPIGKGTGLGLSISYSLVKQHEGEISVESRLGEGARFLVSLPAVE
jgi:signal transduction histidine kinase